MAKKDITYRVFNIYNQEISNDATNLKGELRQRLAKCKVEQRLIPLKENDDSNFDLLGAFAPAIGTNPNTDFFFGTMMRLKPAKEIKALPDNYRELSTLEESALREIQEIKDKIVCSSLYHFLIKGNMLITDLKQNILIDALQIYINKLLMDAKYVFTPRIVTEDLRLRDIKSVVFMDDFSQENATQLSLKSLTRKAIKTISPKVRGLNNIMESKIASARMIIDFERPKQMKDSDYMKKLEAFLAPIQNLENVHFCLKNGKKLQGTDLVYIHKTTLEDDIITPLTYINSMKNVLQSIEKL